jgi:deferrochelatase/peroxidase EfeB
MEPRGDEPLREGSEHHDWREWRPTRREALSGAVLFGAGVGVDRVLGGAGGGSRARASSGAGSAPGPGAAVAFHGAHQAGIATPAQECLYFAAFDLTSSARSDLQAMLAAWTAAAAALTTGARYQPSGAELLDQPPQETGEALGLGAAGLTLTFGFGPRLFGPAGRDRFGLAAARPAELEVLPPFQGESLQSERSGGDLCVQACAENPQVAFHSIHVLSRIATGTAVLRWTQVGFGRTSSTSRAQSTPRNLMGFKDGTDNIRAEDTRAMDEYVWVRRGDGPSWMVGGTYLVARRIKILFDVWDATTLEGQQRVIGRQKLSGAPLGGRGEYGPVNLSASSGGAPVIPANAHIRLASPTNNDGQRILRRGYSYSEGVEAGTGALDAGLFFIAFQRSPHRQFVPLQRRLAGSDALNRHTLHTASAIFACPPGVKPGGVIGEALFAI